MVLQRERTRHEEDLTAKQAPASPPARGIVERCDFEELLERAMEILKARRAAGSGTV